MNSREVSGSIDETLVADLYRRFADQLRKVRNEQRDFLRARRPGMRPKLDDIEAEITYLLLREFRPAQVTEIGTYHGWSTTWILRALRDNGTGRLLSFDLIDNAVREVPAELAATRWEFRHADARNAQTDWMRSTDYLFIDAAHGGRFAKWYIENVFPHVVPGVPVSVHDVFHGRRPLPFTEGAQVIRSLDNQGISYFTAARKRRPDSYARLVALRDELGLVPPIHDSGDNPMIFFRLK
jgi:predicted O-methyltransferase YrrM